jgi:hypothetical protein
MRFLAKRLRWILIGAGAAWLLDPEHGAERRAIVAERSRALLARFGFATSTTETALDPDVVTDVAWETAQYAHGAVDERRLVASGAP